MLLGIRSLFQFYGSVLGCTEGRITDTWVDFDFYGRQISLQFADLNQIY